MKLDRLVDAIINAVEARLLHKKIGAGSEMMYATWVAAESVDSNLSQITLAGSGTCRFVPKLAHVTGLSAGDSILCYRSRGVTLTIIGRPVGDITLAS